MDGLRGALLDALLKGSLLLILAAVANRLLRHRSAASRHAVWTIALLGQLALPVLSARLPTWEVPLLPEIAQSRSVAEPAPGTPSVQYDKVRAGGDAFLQSLPSIQTVLGILWIAGGLALLARLLFGVVTVARLARHAGEVSDGPWPALTRYLATKLRIRRPIRLLRSDRIGVPITWGVRRPTVLLPAGADAWTAERRGLVLVHELAHIKRLDALTQLAAQGTLAVFWVNPLVWIALRQMAAERERACDDYVLRCGAVPSAYAEELLSIVRSLRPSPGPALAALALGLARRSDFEGRMLAILNPRLSRRTLDRRSAVALAALAALLIVPLAAFRPVRKTAAPSISVAKPVVPARLVPVSRAELAAIEAPAVKTPAVTPPSRRTAGWRAAAETRRSARSTPPLKAGVFAPPAAALLAAVPAPAAVLTPVAPKPQPAGKKAADPIDLDGGICFSFATPVSLRLTDRSRPQSVDTAFKVHSFRFHGVGSGDRATTSECRYNVNIVRLSRRPRGKDFDLILAWDPKGVPFTPDTLQALQRLFENPELIDLLRHLAPAKET